MLPAKFLRLNLPFAPDFPDYDQMTMILCYSKGLGSVLAALRFRSGMGFERGGTRNTLSPETVMPKPVPEKVLPVSLL